MSELTHAVGAVGARVESDWTICELLSVPIACVTMPKAIEIVSSWVGSELRPKLVTFSTVHMLVEGKRDRAFGQLLRDMDMNCPDGMPLVWMGKLQAQSISRVCGPDFMPAFCSATAERGYRHFFYGGKAGVAEALIAALRKASPSLQVAGFYTPPFRALTPKEDQEVTKTINESRPDFVWVCLGCPKQEQWIARHRDTIKATALLAVGLAFDTTAGTKKRAPSALHKLGMEWAYRLSLEPRRLWSRYLVSNTLFLGFLAGDFVRSMMLLLGRYRRRVSVR